MQNTIVTASMQPSALETLFVTGGSGFLGMRILQRLSQSGFPLRALARSKSAAERVRSAGAEVVSGDLNALEAIDLRGIDVVIHAAAPVVFWGAWSMYQAGIVDASLALYRRAATQGVRRFIYVSSESVMQGSGDLLHVDASQPYAEPPNSDYGKAKKAAEQALINAFHQSPACELIILRPAFIWSAEAPTLQVIKSKIHEGKFMWIDHGQQPFEAVHVDNVAQAVECAIGNGKSCFPYLVTDNRPYTSRELLGELLRRAPYEVSVPERSVPSKIARPLACLVEGVWRALKLWDMPPPVSRFDVAFLSQPRLYDIQDTIRDLKYLPAQNNC